MGSDWEEVVLNDVLYISKDKVDISSINVPDYISTDNMLPNFGGVECATSLPSGNKISKFQANDILFSNIRTYFKKVWFADKSGACSNDVIVFRSREATYPKFAFYLLANNTFTDYTVVTSKGTKMPRGDKDAILKYAFSLPPLPEQKAIAHILGSLDDKIELNRQMNQTLEAMAQALFKSWFVDFDPVIDNALAAGNVIPDVFAKRAEARTPSPPAPLPEVEGSNNNPPLPSGEGLGVRELFPSEFEYTEEMGWIPKGWGVSSVDESISVNPRITLKKGEIAPFVDMKALPTFGYGIDNVIQKAYSGGAKFENDDVLFARITPCLENGKTGIVDFLEQDEVGFGSTEFIILRGNNLITTPFVACLSRNSKFRAHAKLSMVGSSGRQRVQNACFSTFFLVLPKEKLLRQFDDLTKPNFKKMTRLNNESNTLTKLRDTLLPKLLSGELRIPEAEKLVSEDN